MSDSTSLVVGLVPLVAIPLLVGAALPGPETRLGTRWWFGAVAVAQIVLVGHGIGLPRRVTFTIAVATVLGCSWAALRRRPRARSVTRRTVLYTVLVSALLLAPALTAVLVTLQQPVLGGDSTAIWYAKAKALYQWLPLTALPTPEYPDLGSTYWMVVMTWVGGDHENVGRLIFPLSFFFWVISLLELFPRPYPWVSAAVLPLLATVFFDFEFGTNGYQDDFLMAAAGMSAVLIVKFLMRLARRDRAQPLVERLSAVLVTVQGRQDCYLGAFFAGTLGLIKQEGAVLGLILMSAWAAVLGAGERPSRWGGLARRMWPIGATYLALSAVWPALRLVHGMSGFLAQGEFFTLGSIAHAHMDRWAAVRPYLIDYGEENWSVGIASVVGSVIAGMALPWTRRALIVLWSVLGMHSLFVVVVFFSTRAPLEWHLTTAFHRLMSQHRFALVILLCLTLVLLGEHLGYRGGSPRRAS